MDHANLVDALARFGTALPHVLAGVSRTDAAWRPGEGHWSILEIVAHLADEEVDDFRRRVQLTLEDPQALWPPIDPEGWAVERRYNEGDLAEVLDRFVRERAASVAWLKSLRNPPWDHAHEHRHLGTIRAGDVMAAWAAHDALHLRQLARRFHQLAVRDGEPFSTIYAGGWS